MTRSLLVAAAVLGLADTAAAQQTLNFNLGYFSVLGEGSRTGASCANCPDVDVLVADQKFLTFHVHDFNGFTFGGEWLIPLGQYVEAGAGLAYSQRTVPSVYTNYVNPDLSEIDQSLKLRLLPIDFTMRLLPLRQTSPLQPYIGAGLTLIDWRYEESGNFIDFSNGGQTVYCAGTGPGCDPPYVANGTNTGLVVLGGVRYAGPVFALGGEVRYRHAQGTLNSDFAGNKIDLGGWTYQGTIGFRFGR